MLIDNLASSYVVRKKQPQNKQRIQRYSSVDTVSFSGAVKPQRKNIISVLMNKIRYAVPPKKVHIIDTSREHFLVKTKINPAWGKEPFLFFSFRDQEQTIRDLYSKKLGIPVDYKSKWLDYLARMNEEADGFVGGVYDAAEHDKLHYAIYYKDTGKWDDNYGRGYEVNPSKITKEAISFDKKAHGNPLSRIIRQGEVKGRVVVSDSLQSLSSTLPKSNEPIIAVVEDFSSKDHAESSWNLPLNVRGVIFTNTTLNTLAHNAAYMGAQVDTSAVLYDDKKIKALQKMSGQFVSLKVEELGIKWSKTEPISIQTSDVSRPKVKIPEIVTSDRLLTSSEYEAHLVGPKAYNLRQLEEMKKKGQLKDVEIPTSFVIPCGIFDKTLAANPEKAAEVAQKLQEVERFSDPNDVREKLKEVRGVIRNMALHERSINIPAEIETDITNLKEKLGMGQRIIVRSSYNGEDAKGYSAAGLYDSFPYSGKPSLFFTTMFDAVKAVWASKWNHRAYASRKENNIPHSIVKPSVIVQDLVDADFGFTIYTKDPSSKGNKLLIQMHPKDSADPYIIRYDRDSKKIEVEQIARKPRKIYLNKNGRVVGAEPINNPVKSKQFQEVLKKVCKAAEEVEKNFGTAQDIEGGIKLGQDGQTNASQIYFWQTRDQMF